MDYRYLEAFLATARTLSISKAAKQLSIAQSAVSRQIALLEKSLSTDLFFRGTRGVRLTPRGHLLFHRLQESDQWIKSEFGQQSSSIRIGGLEGVLNFWLGHKLAQASSDELGVSLDLRVMSNEDIQVDLENKHLDLGLSSRKLESEWISSRKLYSEKIVLISAKTFQVDLDHLDRYRWIGVKNSHYLKQASKQKIPSLFISAGSLELLFKLVEAGHGIAAVSESLLQDRKVRIYPLSQSHDAIYLNLPLTSGNPNTSRNFYDTFFNDLNDRIVSRQIELSTALLAHFHLKKTKLRLACHSNSTHPNEPRIFDEQIFLKKVQR